MVRGTNYKPRELSAWITCERLGEEYLTPAGRTMRRRTRQHIDPETSEKDVKAMIGNDDRFIVEWNVRVCGKPQRFSRKLDGTGVAAFKAARVFYRDVASKINNGQLLEEMKQAAEEEKRQADEERLRLEAEANIYSLRRAVDDFADCGMPNVTREKNRKEIVRVLRLFLACTGETKPLAEVGEQAIDKYLKQREGTDGVSRVTTAKELRYIRSFFRKMYKWQKLNRIPEFTIHEVESSRPVMTIEQFESLMEHTGAAMRPCFSVKQATRDTYPRWLWWRAALAVFWESGVRRSELLGLKWENIDWDNNRVLLQSAFTKAKKARFACLGPLSIALLKQLAEHSESTFIPPALKEMVFPFPHCVEAMNQELQLIREAAKIPQIKHFGFHAARHAVGNHLLETAGEMVAQYRLGHTTSTVTKKFYGRIAQQKIAAMGEMKISERLKKLASPAGEQVPSEI